MINRLVLCCPSSVRNRPRLDQDVHLQMMQGLHLYIEEASRLSRGDCCIPKHQNLHAWTALILQRFA